MTKSTMTCSKCGEKMNHHAEKIVYSAAQEAHAQDVFGGALQETHACPGCGGVESRPSGQAGKSRNGR